MHRSRPTITRRSGAACKATVRFLCDAFQPHARSSRVRTVDSRLGSQCVPARSAAVQHRTPGPRLGLGAQGRGAGARSQAARLQGLRCWQGRRRWLLHRAGRWAAGHGSDDWAAADGAGGRRGHPSSSVHVRSGGDSAASQGRREGHERADARDVPVVVLRANPARRRCCSQT